MMNTQNLLISYQQKIEKWIVHSIESNFGQKSKLRDACEYALMNGGKRFRPVLVMMIAESLGKGADIMDAALGVEFFHTASLIADDLPCMDDDDERRNRPSVHKVYGEPVALLASYALISAGYECIARNARGDGALCLIALENAAKITGIQGTTGGQMLDLFPSKFSINSYLEVIDKKTGTLFELSFIYGWIFGGGDLNLLEKVKMAALYFGRAFQIADDLDDMEQDSLEIGIPNLANSIGKIKTVELFELQVKNFKEILKQLNLESLPLQFLIETLKQNVILSVS